MADDRRNGRACIAGVAVAGRAERLDDLRTFAFRLARLPDCQHPAARGRILHLRLRRLETRPADTQGPDHQQRGAEIPHLRRLHLPAALRLPGRTAADLPRQPRRILTPGRRQ